MAEKCLPRHWQSVDVARAAIVVIASALSCGGWVAGGGDESRRGRLRSGLRYVGDTLPTCQVSCGCPTNRPIAVAVGASRARPRRSARLALVTPSRGLAQKWCHLPTHNRRLSQVEDGSCR